LAGAGFGFSFLVTAGFLTGRFNQSISSPSFSSSSLYYSSTTAFLFFFSFILLGHMLDNEDSSSFCSSFCLLGQKLAASVLSYSSFYLLGQKLAAVFGLISSSSESSLP